MKFFKLQLTSYEDKLEIWFVGDESLTERDFGDALSEAMLEVFKRLEDTVEDSSEVKKDYPLFVLALEEDVFLKIMERRGFKKLEPDVVVRGDSYSVLWETPEGRRKLTPLRDSGNLEKFILSKGVELSEEDPNRIIFEEF
jgi:hypothetical protein